MMGTDSRIAWWQSARFGMFVHWGLYTVGGMDCWKMHDMGIPLDEYAGRLEPRFTAEGFDAQAIARLARTAGCRYVVMGARHHEGYCLWDTRTTRFSSVRMTPKRDLVKEYVEAVREAGLRVGLYYSLVDWRYQAYWDGPRKDPQGWKRYVDFVHAQVEELMTGYGRIDVLWYDGAWASRSIPGWGFAAADAQIAREWRSESLNAMVRSHQPDILLNDRSLLSEDFGTPEKKITPEARPWELCDTIGDLWGGAPQDLNWKTPREILNRLFACVSQSGNMLLNIGPNPDGSIQQWQAEIMARIGMWMRRHGEAIYDCVGEWKYPFQTYGLAPWRATRNGDSLYLILVHYPGSGFGIATIHDLYIESAYCLDTETELKIRREPTRDVIEGLPREPPDDIATVVRLTTRPASSKQMAERRTVGLPDPDGR